MKRLILIFAALWALVTASTGALIVVAASACGLPEAIPAPVPRPEDPSAGDPSGGGLQCAQPEDEGCTPCAPWGWCYPHTGTPCCGCVCGGAECCSDGSCPILGECKED